MLLILYISPYFVNSLILKILINSDNSASDSYATRQPSFPVA